MNEISSNEKAKKPKISKLAIASVVCIGIFMVFILLSVMPAGPFWLSWFCGLVSFGGLLMAPVLGISALSEIKRSDGLLRGKGFAITGIAVSGLFILGIILPVITRDSVVPYRLVCQTNLSSLGRAMLIYANENNERYPAADKWCDLLKEELGIREKDFVCKGGPKARCHYAMNPFCEPNSPPDMVLLFETRGGWNKSGGPELLTFDNHGGQGCNILFNNSHVQFIIPEDIGNLKWKVDDDENR